MNRPLKVFVTGITGKQGGAVARHLINSGVSVIGLTRDANSEKAKNLADKGITIQEGNLNEPETYSEALRQASSVFFVQDMMQGHKNEVQQGKSFMDASNEAGIEHFVYASVMGADLDSGVPHFESKKILESHLKSKDIPYTILRPGSFNENFLVPAVKNRLDKGKLVTPLKKIVIQQFIGVDDIGKIGSAVIQNQPKYNSKTITIATDEKNSTQVAEVFSEVMNKPVSYGTLPPILTRIFMGKDLAKMFKYMNKNDFRGVDDIAKLKEEFEGLGDLKSWAKTNFNQ